MSAATMHRPGADQARDVKGKFAQDIRAEDDVNTMGLTGAASTATAAQCHLCPTCQQARDGVDTGEECAIVMGGVCILSPQDCGCGSCS